MPGYLQDGVADGAPEGRRYWLTERLPVFVKITTVSMPPPADPALPDDNDPAVHTGHVNVLADELARLCGLVPLTVREQATEATLDVVNRHLHQQHHDSGGL